MVASMKVDSECDTTRPQAQTVENGETELPVVPERAREARPGRDRGSWAGPGGEPLEIAPRRAAAPRVRQHEIGHDRPGQHGGKSKAELPVDPQSESHPG